MPKRKSRPDEELSEEERARRQRQREVRQKALETRAKGGVFESMRRVTFPKRKPLEARKEEKRIAKRKAENAARRRSVQQAVKKDRASAPDVVVIPIFWKGEAKQMARVLSACADAEAALRAAGRRVLVDGGHKYTPGQKFAHWEHKGVLLRVEIGPREADKGWCTVARTFVAGEAAHRVPRVPIGPETAEEIAKLAALQAPSADTKQHATLAERDAAEALGEQPAARQGAADGARRGDDLEDDYYIVTAEKSKQEVDAEAAEEEEIERPSKSKAGKKAALAKPASKASSRKKVVQF
eukprot:CAMPEP_0174698280 /NCGR_PEP_ID=MMETSP1094-20130205/3912_1 /TAXON_ID=156173 /ORGANISM="Chrysochromulina brevifilum, Strain UTEX LB 985" /LENGTH=296 /DNA_ID=CAMNT_0015895415 /DNA_START=31 /DNA_END=921 /DNA_ORIENTATION=+